MRRAVIYPSVNICAITCKACDSTTTADQLLGIASADTTTGNKAQILTDGYITARRTQLSSSGVWSRDNTALSAVRLGVSHATYGTPGTFDSRTISVNGTINFKDDGGDGDYSKQVTMWQITFDAGAGKQLKMKANSFKFEGTSTVIWDPLGIEYSTDGTTFDELNTTIAPNISKWLYYTSTSSWKTANISISNSNWGGQGNSGGGWVFPISSTQSETGGTWTYQSDALNTWHDINARYVRFTFHSDYATTRPGWDIDMASSTYVPGSPLDATIGAQIFVDKTDYTKVSETTSNLLIGYIAAINADNHSVVIRSLDFSVFDGAKGDKGDAGPTGAAGAGGAVGAIGPTGAEGATGAKGEKGTAGEPGVNGPPGSKGDTGDTGTAGTDGNDGAPGAKGATGATGDTGTQGPQGIQGATGLQGGKGDKGDKGDAGTNGNNGAIGATGDTGAAGTDGNDGAPGAKGATGATGDTGTQGPQGIQGATGLQGGKGDTLWSLRACAATVYLEILHAWRRRHRVQWSHRYPPRPCLPWLQLRRYYHLCLASPLSPLGATGATGDTCKQVATRYTLCATGLQGGKGDKVR